METTEWGPEAQDVLALILPTGNSLREVVDAYGAAGNPDRVSTSPWGLGLVAQQATTRAGELVLDLRRLYKRAREGEEQAAIALALVALEATLLLKQISQDNRAIARLAPILPLWPIIWSPAGSLKTTKQQLKDLNPGGAYCKARGGLAQILIKPTGKKRRKTVWTRTGGAAPNIASKGTFFATAAACYMQGIRAGICQSSCADWADQVQQLSPLSQATAGLWWTLARAEINRSYPDIQIVILGHPKKGHSKTKAMELIREPFKLHIWKLFEFEPPG